MKVPLYNQTETAPGGNIGNVQRAGMVGDAMSRAGEQVMDLGLKVIQRNWQEQADQERARQSTDAETSAILAMKDVEEQVTANRDKHMTFGDDFDEQANERLESISDTITDKSVKEAFRNWSKGSIAKGKIRLSEKGKEIARDNSIAALQENALVLKDQAIRDKQDYQNYKNTLGSAVDVQVELGNIDAADAVKYKDAWQAETIDGHIENDIETNPYQALKDLKKDQYPDLHERRKTYWVKQAESEIGRIESARRAKKEQTDYLAIGEQALATGKPLDHASDDGKKAAEALFQSRFGDVDLDDMGDSKNRTMIVEVFGRLGVVPKSVQSYVRSRSMAGSPEQRVAMADFVSRMEERNPVALRDLSDSDLAFSLGLNKLVKAGIDPKVAIETTIKSAYEMPDGEKTRLKKSYTEDKVYDKNRKALKGASFVKGDVPPKMQSQYEDIVSTFYVTTGGDLDMARSIAERRIGKNWSYNSINKKMMEYAPENVFGDIDPDTKWIDEQFKQTGEGILNKVPKDVKEELEKTLGTELTFGLEADPIFRRNPTVGYQITLPGGYPLLTDDGSDVRFLPDYQKTGRIEKRMKEAEEMADMQLEMRERAILLRDVSRAKTPGEKTEAQMELERTKAYQRIKSTDKKRYK